MHYILFTTSNCNKCPEVKKFVTEKIKFSGKILDDNSDNFRNLILEHNIRTAPTLIIFGEEKEMFRSSETYEIEEFLKENKDGSNYS